MKKRKILVVDDKAAVLEFVQSVLAENGYDVITASDGNELLLKVATEHPDIILSDVMMPKRSGYHALQILRQQDEVFRKIPVVIMTGTPTVLELFQGWQIEGILMKPFRVTDLLQVLEEAWQKSGRSTAAHNTWVSESDPGIADDGLKRIIFLANPHFDIQSLRSGIQGFGCQPIHAPDTETAASLAIGLKPSAIFVEVQNLKDLASVTTFCDSLEKTMGQNPIRCFLFAESSAGPPPFSSGSSRPILFYHDIPSLLNQIRQALQAD